MDKNDPFSNKMVPLGCNHTNGVVCSKINIKVEICSALTLTCAEGRFRPCLPILQNPQQFSDELQNYILHFTHTHRTLC